MLLILHSNNDMPTWIRKLKQSIIDIFIISKRSQRYSKTIVYYCSIIAIVSSQTCQKQYLAVQTQFECFLCEVCLSHRLEYHKSTVFLCLLWFRKILKLLDKLNVVVKNANIHNLLKNISKKSLFMKKVKSIDVCERFLVEIDMRCRSLFLSYILDQLLNWLFL